MCSCISPNVMATELWGEISSSRLIFFSPSLAARLAMVLEPLPASASGVWGRRRRARQARRHLVCRWPHRDRSAPMPQASLDRGRLRAPFLTGSAATPESPWHRRRVRAPCCGGRLTPRRSRMARTACRMRSHLRALDVCAVRAGANVPRTMTTSCASEACSLGCDAPMRDFTSWATIPFTLEKSPLRFLFVPVSGTVLHSPMASAPAAILVKAGTAARDMLKSPQRMVACGTGVSAP